MILKIKILIHVFLFAVLFSCTAYAMEKGLVTTKDEKVAEETAARDSYKTMTKEERQEAARKDFVKNYAIYEGDIDSGIVPLGQSAGVIHSIESVADIIEKCVKDAKIALNRISNYVI